MQQFNRKTDLQRQPNVMQQIGLRRLERANQVQVDLNVIERLPTFNASVAHCIGISGLDRKEVYGALEIDAGTWSKMESGKAYFPHPKLESLYDICGNEAPLIWQMHSRGYDWRSVREKQTEMQKEITELRQENADLKRLFRMKSELGTEA
jgi:hypothetical protein